MAAFQRNRSVAGARGRLVALYGSSYALSQLAGPLLLGVLGTEHDYGFWVGVGLLVASNAPFDHAFAAQHGAHLTVLTDEAETTADQRDG